MNDIDVKKVISMDTENIIKDEILNIVKKHGCTIAICQSIFDDTIEIMKKNATL